MYSRFGMYSLFLLLFVVPRTLNLEEHSRHKRALPDGSLPRLATKDGHLIIMSATNHNITFRSSRGGFVNVDGLDLKAAAVSVKEHTVSIAQLQQVTSSIPSQQNRLNVIENNVNSLSSLTNQITQIRARLAVLETHDAVKTTALAHLNTRYNTLLSRTASLSSSFARVKRRVRRNECNSSPCANGGTCIDQYSSYLCLCPKGFTGPRCNTDVNECVIYSGTDMGCQNGGTCLNTHGSYTCTCPPNYHGVHCTTQHNDCATAPGSELCGHGTCVTSGRSVHGQAAYTCICEQGWAKGTHNTAACTRDVNECTTVGSSKCAVNVQCINIPGSFRCGQCPAGFSGNGYQCSDINECLMSNGGCSRVPRVDCYNTPGSRRCGACPEGYRGNGVSCMWVGMCGLHNGGCHPLARCAESPGFGSRMCTCPPGYIGNGVGTGGCVQQSSPCVNQQCGNHGACMAQGASYTCHCYAGFTGTLCQVNVNECANNPCQNGGTCVDGDNGFTCTCTNQYTGPTCTQEQQECGGRLNGQSGSFHFPENGLTFPRGSNCAWVIRTRGHLVIHATFTLFDLSNHGNCRGYDYINIHDGGSSAAYRIGRFCGTRPPSGEVVGTRRRMYISYYSDRAITGGGFTVSWTSSAPVCGGTRNATHGTIRSPGYPGRYPHNRDCVWTISVTPGKVIQFTFATIAIEQHHTCNYDFLEIRDGLLSTDTLLQRYCHTVTPPPQLTTGPNGYVRFHSDGSLTDRGFVITYSQQNGVAGCGGIKTSPTGTLTSPNFPQPYNHNSQCVWLIRVSSGSTVTLTFITMDIESHSTCNYDYLEIYNGASEDSPLVSRYCGSELPATFTSSSNSVWVKFKSDINQAGVGFKLEWVTSCGGTYTAQSGMIQSPNYPNNYNHSQTCEYVIRQAEGMVITLSFTAFDVEGDATCQYDYVQIYDGQDTNANQLGTTSCGTNSPGVVVSTQNVMFMRFVTDGTVAHSGFRANYTTSESADGGGCGGTLPASSAVIMSPGYPNTHPHGLNCTWFVSVSAGMIIQLRFTTFSVEASSTCRYDYVQVYDNSTSTNLGTSVGKYCGSTIPPMMTSTDNTISVVFVSGSAVISQGNVIQYCGSTIPPMMTSTDNTISVVFVTDGSIAHGGFHAVYTTHNASTMCGGTLTNPTGVITSPNFPNNYPHHRTCIWTIIVASGRQILLNVTDFNIEYHRNCNYDYLEIRNGGDSTSPLIDRKFCGSTISSPIIRSHSNRLWLLFRTDSSQTRSGFQIIYDGTDSGCGGTMLTPTGSFVSPNYPLPYNHRATCTWTIGVSQGSHIQLMFVDFDLEDHYNCRYDYISITNRQRGAVGPRLCGTTLPQPITQMDNYLRVAFITDRSVPGRGFHAVYNTLCNVELSGFSGVITSPNFPRPYPHRTNCNWVIKAPRGNTVNVTFSHFNLETHSRCSWDKLEIRDGPNVGAPLLGTFCGSDMPPMVGSSGRSLSVKMVTDISVSGDGFRLEWYVIGCGGDFTNQLTGLITSPNYPQAYNPNQDCEWRINVPQGMKVQLNFTDYHMESHDTCRYDNLKIFAGMDDTGPLVNKLCAPQPPFVTTVTGNNAFLRFSTDHSVQTQGFSMRFTAVTGGCGGNITAPAATIHSPNFGSGSYPRSTNCYWLINVTKSGVVELTINAFDVEFHNSCNYDYLAFYDGPDSTYPLLGKVCGNGLPSPHVFKSTQRTMYVRFRTDPSLSGTGFSASYVTGCGGTYDADAGGAIHSPHFPQRYPLNSNCSYLLRSANADAKVSLTFSHMAIENNQNCSSDYVAVYDGSSADAPLKGRYCGHATVPMITTEGSDMFVQFVTDNDRHDSGFYAAYSTSTSEGPDMFVQFVTDGYRYDGGFYAAYSTPTSVCGAELTAYRGAFNSPGYPNSIFPNTECTWTIATAIGNRISFTFSLFDLPADEFCNDNYLQIRRYLGNNNVGAVIGRFCGVDTPTNLTHLMSVSLKLRSGDSATGRGFMASYVTDTEVNLSGRNGRIQSPLYGHLLPPNINHAWTITVATNHIVSVWFRTFDLEAARYGECRFDYLLIRDGGETTSPVLKRYCGVYRNNMYPRTTGNQMRLELHTDASVTGEGFDLSWYSYWNYRSRNQRNCGSDITLQNATSTTWITSPNYPSNYNRSLNCYWDVTVPAGYRPAINVTDFAMRRSYRCRRSGLSLYGMILRHHYRYGSSVRPRQVLRHCGYSRPTGIYTSDSRMMRIKFSTGSYYTSRGFNLTIKAVCGGMVEEPQGILLSPNYPSNYPNNHNCTWLLSVARGRTIQVTFEEDFNLYSGSPGNCLNDYILLLNGNTDQSPPLGDANRPDGRYCGTSTPTVPESNDNYVYVSFISDRSNTASGFKLTWREKSIACDATYHLTDAQPSVTIMSPNHPATYPQNTNCIWIFTAPVTERIMMHFQSPFGIGWGHTRYCVPHVLRLRDGGTIQAQVISSLCGHSVPASQVSTGNALYVRFKSGNVWHSSTLYQRQGFKATVSIGTCGGRILLASPQPTRRYRPSSSTIPATPSIITSPNFPLPYESNTNCGWTVVAPDGHFMTITFVQFTLESSTNCTKDSLIIRDRNSTGTILSRSCGSTTPTPITTAGSQAYISFVTDSGGVRQGFKLSISASIEECGGTFTNQASGTFTSPGYPNPYPNHRRCTWRITVAKGRKVTLNFDSMDLEAATGGHCYYDVLYILNGLTHGAPRIGRRCGTNTDPISSSDNTMMVVFRTDGRTGNSGFSARWDSNSPADCGANLAGPFGNITSPGYDSGNYSNNMQCNWLINNPTRVNSSIALHFLDFDLEGHSECWYDKVVIYLGIGENSYQAEKYCGNNTLEPFVTYESRVRIRFVTDSSRVGRGFVIAYNFTQCGGILSTDNGVVTSPNYPNNYGLNERCAWLIQAPTGSRILVNVTAYSIEASPGRCIWDHLEIFNGALYDSPSMGRFCNSTNPPSSFVSQTHGIRVNFFTDVSEHHSGFRIIYSFQSEGCGGGTYHGKTGYITSQNYPAYYPHNIQCQYNINVEQGYLVNLTFNEPFDIQGHAECDNDYIQVTDILMNGTERELNKTCGHVKPSSVVSTAHNLLVTFRSDSSSDGQGFSANWTSSCGGEYNEERGRLQSPGYPNRYGNNLDCTYTIRTDPDKYIVLVFRPRSFSIAGRSRGRHGRRNCYGDYIQITRFGSRYGNRAHARRYCGTTPPPHQSSRGRMVIHFHTNSYMTATGYSAMYWIDQCGGTFNDTAQVLSPPTHPAQYLSNMNCHFFINVRPNRVIRLKFLMFHLEPHSSCGWDHLSVYDGYNSSAPLLAKVCGYSKPDDILSTGNMMYINFVSDHIVSANGFRVLYMETLGPAQGCGGVLNVTTGSLTSPTDSNGQYYNYTQCDWTITVPTNKVVNLTVTSMDIEYESQCRYDYLRIADGLYRDAPQLYKRCGNGSAPQTFVSTTNNLRVTFFSDHIITGRGFNASYTINNRLCGGAYFANTTSQAITSPSYPSPYPASSCRWIITSSSGLKLHLTVTNFNMATSDCTNNYLGLRDSPLGQQGRHHQYCGTVLPPQFESAGQAVSVSFKASTAGTSTSNGFRLTYLTSGRCTIMYLSVKASTPGTASSNGFRLTYLTRDCNRVWTAMNGRIVNPRWPSFHDNNENCDMRISTPAGTTIALYFTAFRMEGHSNCLYDHLEIRNGTNATNSGFIAKLCGHSIPNPVFVDGNNVWMHFKSDGSVTFAGYDMTYVASTAGTGCGGTLTSINGTITSPLYPSNDTSTTDHNCDWLIHAPSNRPLVLRFDMVRRDGVANCTEDSLQIRQGSTAAGAIVSTICGSPLTTNIFNITGSQVFLRYHTNGAGPSLVFRMRYTS